MLAPAIAVLDWMGVIVCAITGALVASRKQMDVFGFILLGTVTGIGGGTLRDIFLDLPVFWVRNPTYLIVTSSIAVLVFFTAHIPRSRYRVLLWFDAVGLATFAAIGAQIASEANGNPIVIVAMGVVTSTFGGILRDIIGREIPVILSQEVYVTAALLGCSAFAAMLYLNLPRELALATGFVVTFLVRGAGITWNLSLPRYRSRPARDHVEPPNRQGPA